MAPGIATRSKDGACPWSRHGLNLPTDIILYIYNIYVCSIDIIDPAGAGDFEACDTCIPGSQATPDKP